LRHGYFNISGIDFQYIGGYYSVVASDFCKKRAIGSWNGSRNKISRKRETIYNLWITAYFNRIYLSIRFPVLTNNPSDGSTSCIYIFSYISAFQKRKKEKEKDRF